MFSIFSSLLPLQGSIFFFVLSSLILSSPTAHHHIMTQSFASSPCPVRLLEYCPKESRESVLLFGMPGWKGSPGKMDSCMKENRPWEDMGLRLSKKDACKVKLGS